MYISRIYIRNYKNFDEFDLYIPNGEPLTIIGGNNTGKTNLLQAIRLVLDTSLPPWEKRLSEDDFCWSNGNDECWKSGEEVVITITFSNVSNKEEIKAFLYSIRPSSKTPADDIVDENLDANISFVFAPSTFNKETEYDINDDYIGFLISGRHHPSGYHFSPTGEKIHYDNDTLRSLYACEDIKKFYKHFYLSKEDIEIIREKADSTFEKRIMKQLYANKIRKHVNMLFLDALRDVKNNFAQGYNSLVSQLLRTNIQNSKKNNNVGKELTTALKSLRTNGSMNETVAIIEEIENRLQNEKVNLLSNKADLKISTPKITLENIGRYFNFLVDLKEDLKDSLDMNIVGLGYQNLAYISAIFALFELKKEIFLNDSDEKYNIVYNLLLIEEPEAHLDVQNQKYLHTQIENKTEKLMLENDPEENKEEEREQEENEEDEKSFFAFTQVIQTSHSTHLTSKSNLKNIVVMQKALKQTTAVNIDNLLQIDSEKYSHRRRILKQYLDATRSALLFARKIILVEGLSEKYALGALTNHYLQKNNPDNKNIDIDSEGIEIVEVGGKNFDSFTALFNTDASQKLNNKCLCLHDGDSQLSGDVTNYTDKYKELNNELSDIENKQVIARNNIYTFEIDTYFLPNPDNANNNNLDYLKLILLKFKQDGDYYKTDETFKNKLSVIDSLAKDMADSKANKEKLEKFFSEIFNYEVSKPSMSLYLSSLLKAKLMNDGTEKEAWMNDEENTFGIKEFDDLPDFVIPKYINEGLSWLITEKN